MARGTHAAGGEGWERGQGFGGDEEELEQRRALETRVIDTM